MKWNPHQYLKFERERSQLSMDLTARLVGENFARILDVGCGPGNSTAVLARAFPNAEITGIDNSPEMIAVAKKTLPSATFLECDAAALSTFKSESFDLVFSNACLQWVPGHKKIIPEMMRLLSPKGMLAVQIPSNRLESIHLLIAELIGGEKWSAKIPRKRIFYNLKEDEYFDLLAELSSEFYMWKTVYFHAMESHEALWEWYKGTGLRPYLEQLSESDAVEFKKEFLSISKTAYPARKNGKVIFRFPRLFFTARR